MRAGNQSRILSLATLLAFLIAAALPVRAWADDSAPPMPDAPSTEVAPTDAVAPQPAPTEAADAPAAEAAPTAEVAADTPQVDAPIADASLPDLAPIDPAAVEAPPADGTVIETAPPADGAAVSPDLDSGLTAAQILDAAPDGTALVVQDPGGVALPLASEAAAAALITGDPVWCPTGKLPGDTGCTASHAGFYPSAGDTGLLWDLRSQTTPGVYDYKGPGTIYVAQGTVADTGSIFFDQKLVGLTDLVVQGGWDFGSSSVAGTSTFDLTPGNGLYFLDWGEGAPGTNLTLKDIVVNGDGLYVVNSDPTHLPAADVTLDNVTVSDTARGALVRTLGDVDVRHSHFDSNDPAHDPLNYPYDPSSADYPYDVTATGLFLNTGGNVTLNDVTASGNHGNGLEIYSFKGDTPGAVLLQNSVFDNNVISDEERLADECCWSLGWGFVVGNGNSVPTGTTLSKVSSNGNTRGATIFSGGDLTITGSQFNQTQYASPAGLTLWSGGIVTLQGISASYNQGGDGVDIFGPWNGGDPTNPYNGSPMHVEIQDSTFSGNDGSVLGYDAVNGVFIVIGSGSATVSGSIFFDNTGYGIGGVGSGTLTEFGNVFSGNRLGSFGLFGGGTVVSAPLGLAQLPAALPEGWTFVAGMDVITVASGAQLAFDIPSGTGGTLKVLAWSGTQWVEVASSVVGGQVFFAPSGPGIFVLVSG